jgi:hypothetical protein
LLSSQYFRKLEIKQTGYSAFNINFAKLLHMFFYTYNVYIKIFLKANLQMVVGRCPAAEEPDQHAGQLLRPHFLCLQYISNGPTQFNHYFWSVVSKKKDKQKNCMKPERDSVTRFLILVFFMNHLPPPSPENNIRVIETFFENSQRYTQVKVYHRCQLRLWKICHRYQ